ncbi:MAG: Nif3-like dinuclear metal center hexameric protein [Helicobacteraceae bacterium]|jgi:dinuclear metal center YbgI/SA1388 family protein|nr:Nif3-like dinuclear metal center hexameric protein [Helicobacteraceae bacterium]
MIVGDLLNICDRISPFGAQEKWDNSGLIIGDPNAEVLSVCLSLEADGYAISALPNGTALIVHHPLIFTSLKSLNFAEYPALLIRDIIQKNAALIAMHTNFDKSHLNSYVAKEILGWRDFRQEELVCYHKTRFDFKRIAGLTRDAFGSVKSIAPPPSRKEYRVAFCCGSGGALIGEIECDILITGDLKYHDAIKAKTLGIGVIDVGHFESERYFGAALQKELSKYDIKSTIVSSQNPLGVYDSIRESR